LQLSKIEDDIKTKKNEAENLNDAANDIESLLDDDACKVRVGEVFIDVPNEEAEEFVKQQLALNKEKLDKLLQSRTELVKKMDALKALLYAKFGKQINLESAEQTREE
jgi:prefoldin subunit 4